MQRGIAEGLQKIRDRCRMTIEWTKVRGGNAMKPVSNQWISEKEAGYAAYLLKGYRLIYLMKERKKNVNEKFLLVFAE